MSWEGGVDLVAMTEVGMPQPNIIVHVAREVQTPVGSAPAGMVLYAPNPESPEIMGFVCPDRVVGEYFGPNIFAGTPFEHAPVLDAEIDIFREDTLVGARVRVMGHLFETRLQHPGAPELIQRPAGSPMPFAQQGIERACRGARLVLNGETVAIFLPEIGPTGGAPAVFAPAGIYAR